MLERPSIIKIVRNDYLSSLTVLAPAVVWGMTLLFLLLGNSDWAGYRSLAVATTIVAIPLLLWRSFMISRTLTEGVDVPAVVSNAGFFRGRGRISYVYSYLGDKLESSNAVQQNKQTTALTVGSNVTVALDQNNPKRAFIRELYT